MLGVVTIVNVGVDPIESESGSSNTSVRYHVADMERQARASGKAIRACTRWQGWLGLKPGYSCPRLRRCTEPQVIDDVAN